MKQISQFQSDDGARTAEVRFSMNKQIYYARISEGTVREFYTPDEAEDWCEDWVLGDAVYDQKGDLIEPNDNAQVESKIIECGPVELEPVKNSET